MLLNFFLTSYPCVPDLLYKPILTACPCLDRPTRASVLSGYTDSVVGKVLILPPRQVYQKSGPSKGVSFLESSVAAIVYYAPQPLQLLRVTCDTLATTGRPCPAGVGPIITRRRAAIVLQPPTNQTCCPPILTNTYI
jgi:hypothetical protein